MSECSQRSAPTVVLTRPLASAAAEAWLRQRAEVRVAAGPQLGQAIRGADALIAVWPERVSAELLAGADRLTTIATVTAGSDHVDVAAAEGQGVEVVTGAGAGSNAVAEYVMWAAIGLSRGFHLGPTLLEGEWAHRLHALTAQELVGRSLGIVGFGHIGQCVARYATTFGMRVVVHDPYARPDHLGPGVELGALDTVLASSDVLTLNVPLTATTRGLIREHELELLGPDGILVNASRGGVVDESALVAALRVGALRGASVDVFASEPPDQSLVQELLSTGRVLLTPHLAGYSEQSVHSMCQRAAEAAVRRFNQNL